MERRDLLRGALAGAGLLTLGRLALERTPAVLGQPHDVTPPAGAALDWRARLAPASEPGQPMILAGTLIDSDGRTPVAGATVYAYHTAADGLYSRTGSLPRLRGWMKTDAAGRFQLQSIRPAAYPGRTIPAHVHFNAWGAGHPRQGFEQIEFEGDPLVTPERLAESRKLGRFGFVRRLVRSSDGIWRGRLELRFDGGD
ncbi:MAG TPA: hypothetical protein VNO33_17370 [Kofleriaceae bacterium]|nr:hypothetical protein [Kofleriaceae bacterium]